MRSSALRAALPVLLAGLLGATPPPAAAEAPCVELAAARAGDADGIGGTGLGDEDGIGGTGLGGDEDGIGGSGLGADEDGIGGSGLFGTITGLGSICMNGLRVHVGNDVAVSRDGAPATLEALAVGRVAWVRAERREGRLEARRIAVESALRGPVESLSLDARRLRVAGTEVLLGPEAALPEAELRVGEPVAVSGLWQDEARVIASRIERLAAPTAPARRRFDAARRAAGLTWLSLEGHLEPRALAADRSLHGLGLELPRAPTPQVGSRVWVRGRLADGRLVSERLVVRPDPPRAPRRPTRPQEAPPAPPQAPSPAPVTKPDLAPRPERIERPVPPERPERPPVIDRIEPVDRQVSPQQRL